MRRTTILALVAVVAASVAAGLGAIWATTSLVDASVLRANNEVAGNYLQTLGTFYAVLLAFVVFVVWSQFNDARKAVEEESNEIADLCRTVQRLPSGGAIRARLRTYVETVAAREWPKMAHGRMNPDAVREFNDLWAALSAVQPSTPSEETLLGEALARFNGLSDARSSRLLASRVRLPPTMWILLITGAVLTVGSMALFGVPSFAAHCVMTGSLAGLNGLILYIVLDLDNPFWGDWQVEPEPLLKALETASAGEEKAKPESQA